MRNRWRLALSVVLVGASCALAAGGGGQKMSTVDRTVTFAEGDWDASKWTLLRLPSHESTATFTQRPDCIGTNSFTKEEKTKHLDNVILMTDSGSTEGELEVVFRIGKERGAAPGVVLSPTYRDGVLYTGIAVFVADYTMAAWRFETDAQTRETKYAHLVRIARWQDPAVKHVLRCRYSKKRRSMALRIDQSDTVVLRFPDHEINSRIGIWGCHGTCDYYSIAMRHGGTLEWSGRAPQGKPQ